MLLGARAWHAGAIAGSVPGDSQLEFCSKIKHVSYSKDCRTDGFRGSGLFHGYRTGPERQQTGRIRVPLLMADAATDEHGIASSLTMSILITYTHKRDAE